MALATTSAAANTSGQPYDGSDIVAAYKEVFGGLPAGMMDSRGNLADGYEKIFPGTALKTPTGQDIDSSQLMYMYQQGQASKAAQAAQAAGGANAGAGGAAGAGSAGQSYLSQAPQTNPTMANNPTTSSTTGQPQVSDQQAIQYFVNHGGYASVDPQTARSYFDAQNPNFGASGVDAQKAIDYYIQQGGNSKIDPATAISYYEQAHPDELAKGVANAALQPEQRANQQMAQIDPASEALRTQVSQSYAAPLAQAASGGPSASDLQSYLNTYQQTDPAGYAQRQQLGQSVSDLVTQVTGQAPKSEADALAQYQQIDPQGYAQRMAMYGQTQGQIDTAKGAYGQAQEQTAQAKAALSQVNDYVTKVTGQAPQSPADALQQYAKLDPQGYANIQSMGGAMGDWLKQTNDQLNLGSQLDPVTARQVQQATRAGQAARGNVYGTPQMAEEAMTTGQAGLALQAQRQAAEQAATQGMQSYLGSGTTAGAVGNSLYNQGLTNQNNAYGVQQSALGGVDRSLAGQQQALGGIQSAIGNQQSWLGSGQTIADVANSRYQQGIGNRGAVLGQQQSYLGSGLDLGSTALSLYNQNQANLRTNQQGALSYLSSGQTPYQAGAGYLSGAEQTAAGAAQGGPVYNPSALGAGQAGTSQQAPQYGLDVGSQSQNYFNSLQNQYGSGAGGAPQKNRMVGAGVGALSGAASGAAAGSVIPVYGTAIGAVAGAVAGGVSGYYS